MMSPRSGTDGYQNPHASVTLPAECNPDSAVRPAVLAHGKLGKHRIANATVIS